MTKLKFEGKTFYLYVSQKEVSAGFLLSRKAGVLGWSLTALNQSAPNRQS